MAGKRFNLYVHGRLHRVSRRRLEGLVAKVGGRLVRKPGPLLNLVALGHATARATLGALPPIKLPAGVPTDVPIISEMHLKRLIGLHPPHPEELRVLSASDLARASSLDEAIVQCLVLYDVLDPQDGQFGFRDLRAAREVRRLIDLRFGLDEIVEASVALARHGRGLHDTALAEAPWGEIVQQVAGRMGRLDGQFTLPLDEPSEGVDALFDRAEDCEASGELAEAERLYRIAMGIDRTDPIIPFNLGNVLSGLDRRGEAMLAYQQALARDPEFSEAWVNLANLEEASGKAGAAEQSLRRALSVDPDLDAALYNLALLLTRAERYGEALPWWDRYLGLTPPPKDAREAARMAMLCRVRSAIANRDRGRSGRGAAEA
jgi:tetratricopeptide (TPR) repeat protein